jgi:hypothetical protein
MELIRRERGKGAAGRGTDLQGALGAVVGEERFAEDGGELAGGVAAEQVHLEEAVLCGDVALSDEEVVEVRRAKVRDAVGIALNCDRSGESGNGDGAVELGKIGEGCVVDPAAQAKEAGDGESG